MRIVLFGAPGAGKGTIAGVLRARVGAVHIATGDLCRAKLKETGALSEKLRSYVDKGELVPDDLIIAMLEQRLNQPDAAKGFMLDGFPRTLAQAEKLDGFLAARGQNLEAVLELQAGEELIVKRISGRRICPSCNAIYNIYTMPSKVEGRCDRCGADLIQRKDDHPEAVAVRLRAYREQTAPLLGYYRPRHLLYSVDAEKGSAAAAEDILKILEELETAAAKG